MQIPQSFIEDIGRIFGNEGQAWLKRLPQTLALCQERWRLTDMRPASGLTYNFICFAKSPEYGEVVLKLAVRPADIEGERQALTVYAGQGICACYDAEPTLGALVLERIVPGTDLTTVQNSEDRFQIAAELFVTLPVAVKGDQGFPAYWDWINKAFNRARAENRVGPRLLSLVDEAERLFREIDTPDGPHLLLHGDLHHRNILRDGRGRWRAIDPKGVLGVACMGAARFMQNEFRMGDPTDRFERLDRMTAIFGERFGESREILARCLFVEQVLATCWNAEESVAPESLQEDVEVCAVLLDYCKRIQ